jgi:peptidoglycan/xylan/chitin deacetylase (PgdA/CDA1 family)
MARRFPRARRLAMVAAVFIIGGNARRHLPLVERIRREGHEVANHTSGLEGTWRQPLERFQSSVIDAERLLGLESVTPRFLRPAGGLIRGPHLDWVRGRGYICVLGSAYPYDPASPPVAYMTWLISKNLEPGAIVILHDSGQGRNADRSRTVAAVPGVLDAGRRKGLRFVTLSKLWSARAVLK